jgi:hypothetical protein
MQKALLVLQEEASGSTCGGRHLVAPGVVGHEGHGCVGAPLSSMLEVSAAIPRAQQQEGVGNRFSENRLSIADGLETRVGEAGSDDLLLGQRRSELHPRLEIGVGRPRRKTARTMLKIVVVEPMPRARASAATARNPGERNS